MRPRTRENQGFLKKRKKFECSGFLLLVCFISQIGIASKVNPSDINSPNLESTPKQKYRIICDGLHFRNHMYVGGRITETSLYQRKIKRMEFRSQPHMTLVTTYPTSFLISLSLKWRSKCLSHRIVVQIIRQN